MPIHPDRVDFSDEDVGRIIAALPPRVKNGRVEALGYILRDWGCIDLPDNLSQASLPSEWKQSSQISKHWERREGSSAASPR